MFDKLIVSDEQGAEFKGRSRYFMVSTVVVGVMFVTALVFSLYASDIGLGNDEFELSTMLAPVTPADPEPPREQPRNQQQQQEQQSQVETRAENMLRPDEVPKTIPTDISVTPNTHAARPHGYFEIGDVDKIGSGGPAETGTRTGSPVGSSSETVSDTTPVETVPPPPPVVAAKSKPRPPVTGGVINGRAIDLPHPRYPEPAKLVGAQGAVNVQVTIDETGKVISAKAVGGHPLLRPEAEKAAWRAKFSITYLTNVPVKVTGVIIYNFKKS